jgi:hypothetical protein
MKQPRRAAAAQSPTPEILHASKLQVLLPLSAARSVWAVCHAQLHNDDHRCRMLSLQAPDRLNVPHREADAGRLPEQGQRGLERSVHRAKRRRAIGVRCGAGAGSRDDVVVSRSEAQSAQQALPGGGTGSRGLCGLRRRRIILGRDACDEIGVNPLAWHQRLRAAARLG